jgi:hypothetical protein
LKYFDFNITFQCGLNNKNDLKLRDSLYLFYSYAVCRGNLFATNGEPQYPELVWISKRVNILSNALFHEEPGGLVVLWRKNHRYGNSERQLARTGHYSILLSKKRRLRRSRGLSKNRIMSSILVLLKAPAYFIGFYIR